ncbi:hypothetical protein KHA80_12605 [Anaerobacillus sp. HL2]|nr:hypothetical protein KHA80_12605 [Anaerobacillus sp. HL2]
MYREADVTSSNRCSLQSQLQKHNRIQLYIQIENYIKEKVEKKFAAIDQSFYNHYRSIPEFMEKISDPLHVSDLSKVYLDELLQK